MSWRQFSFFKTTPIRDPNSPDDPVFGGVDVSSTTARAGIWIVASHTLVSVVNITDLTPKLRFSAGDDGSVTFMQLAPSAKVLLTITEGRSFSSDPFVQLWDLSNIKDKTPQQITSFAVAAERQNFPLSAFSASDDFSFLAFGFANGTIVIARGDLIHDRGVKQRIALDGSDPITGLFFAHANRRYPIFYVSTTSKLFTIDSTGRTREPLRVLDETGCALGCMAFDSENQSILVARDSSISLYDSDGRLPNISFESSKQSAFFFNNYLALSAPTDSDASPDVSSVLNTISYNNISQRSTKVVIIDTHNHIIAYTSYFPSGIRSIFYNNSELYILSLDSILYQLSEISLENKIEILQSKSFYSLALQVAQNASASPTVIDEIHKAYGDYLYSKGNLHEAMTHYIQSITSIYSGDVIRKYIDGRNISDLSLYLEKLHDIGRASTEHTTLLLNCYAIQKDEANLSKYIRSHSTNIHLDFDRTIELLRHGGYYYLASYLAQRYEHSEMVVSIRIQDMDDYLGALEFISSLPPEEAIHNIQDSAYLLLTHIPEETLKFLIRLYTGEYIPQKTDLTSSASLKSSNNSIAVKSNNGDFSPSITKTEINGNATSPVSDYDVSASQYLPYDLPNPESIFPAFADLPVLFCRFLEALLQKFQKQDNDNAKLTNLFSSLFEVYLTLSNSQKDNTKELYQHKALELCQHPMFPRGVPEIVLTAHLNGFKDIKLIIKHEDNFHVDLFRAYTSAEDISSCIELIHNFGNKYPLLYVLALSYFSSSESILQRTSNEIPFILEQIDKFNLLSPLEVLQTLGTNSAATIGLMRKYLLSVISKDKNTIEHNMKLAQSYKAEADSKAEEILNLTTKPQLFQSTKCTGCGGHLDLPTVHFLCKHSYHQRCLADVVLDYSEEDKGDKLHCPKCAPNIAALNRVRKAHSEVRDKHDVFKTALASSTDKFALIADFVGRGMLDTV
ncbi:hypothetical protein CANCADRAFT_88871 [Tortispora caseinolytica NRRL Y-17796]|uniref:E3 ubiquitin-protein ligase PEP5 n=1 Tax=Tortispora caseinolytica NRRL Y-17796 TaxID=767744 RepID=A0A1E4TLA2_9ASCO|nr:hypothetical protein CANCADRAFT_88871 [Tortispora caseinolytica NRRL Y-17796]